MSERGDLIRTTQRELTARNLEHASVDRRIHERLPLYATYAISVEQGEAAPTGTDNASKILSPHRDREYEAGAKYQIAPGFLITAAGFRMTRPLATTIGITNIFAVVGTQRNWGELFGHPERLAADTAYGSAENLAWLVHERGIEPYIPVFDHSDRHRGRLALHIKERIFSPDGNPDDARSTHIRRPIERRNCSVGEGPHEETPDFRPRRRSGGIRHLVGRCSWRLWRRIPPGAVWRLPPEPWAGAGRGRAGSARHRRLLWRPWLLGRPPLLGPPLSLAWRLALPLSPSRLAPCGQAAAWRQSSRSSCGVNIMRFVRSWLTLATLPLAFSACAQPAPPPATGGMSLDQFLSRQTSRIMAADTDGDGKVSRAEMAAAAKNGRDPSRRFDAMDTNHDGMLDANEIRAALTRRFHRLDRNGDGMLTPDERMAGRTRARQAEPADPAASPQP
jgi:hypothetical protein